MASEQICKKTPDRAKRVTVIGAGAGGLAIARRLQQRGHETAVLERGPEVGGLAAGFRFGSTILDRFYRHMFTSDAAIIRFIEEMGLKDSLRWLDSSVGIYHGGRQYAFSQPQHLLGFSPMSLWGRFRFGLGFLRMKFENDWRKLERFRCEDYIIRMMGANAYRVVWEPLLRSKFGKDYRDVSAAWFWGKIKLRGGTRDESGRKEKLGYLWGGFAQLFERAAQEIESQGGQVLTNMCVQKIEPKSGGGFLIHHGDGTHETDAVVCTAAPAILSELCPALGEGERTALTGLNYQGSIVVVLPLLEPLESFYWLNVNDPSYPFVAVINQRKMVDDPDYAPHYPVYLSRYLSTDDPLYSMPANELVPLFTKEFLRMFPKARLDPKRPGWRWKARYTQPVVPCGYSETAPPFETGLPGLFLSSMAQIYPEDRGMNYAIDCGERFVKWWHNEPLDAEQSRL